MHCRQPLIADLQPPGLAHPGKRSLHHVANLAQAAPMRGPRRGQVVFDAALLQAPMVTRRAILPVPVQGLRLAARAPAAAADRRDVVEQRHRFERLVAIGSGEAEGERRPLAIDTQVPLAALFGPIRGVFAGKYPPKTAR
jgi:hypothetical protein